MIDNFHKFVLDQSPVGYAFYRVICDQDSMPCDYEFIDANPAFKKMTGLTSVDIAGRKATEVLPSMWNGKFDLIAVCEKIALNGGGNIAFEHYFEPLGRWCKINVFSPSKNYFE